MKKNIASVRHGGATLRVHGVSLVKAPQIEAQEPANATNETDGDITGMEIGPINPATGKETAPINPVDAGKEIGPITPAKNKSVETGKGAGAFKCNK